jgi:hypothetical protein
MDDGFSRRRRRRIRDAAYLASFAADLDRIDALAARFAAERERIHAAHARADLPAVQRAFEELGAAVAALRGIETIAALAERRIALHRRG